MRLFALALLLGLCLQPVGLAFADEAQITMECVNPRASIPIEYHQTGAGGRGQASSAAVQFNINQPPGPGTVFVDQRNNGQCTLNILSNHIITRAWSEFVPGGSSIEHIRNIPDHPADYANSIIGVDARVTGNKRVVFDVSRRSLEIKASVTLTFFVEYRPAS